MIGLRLVVFLVFFGFRVVTVSFKGYEEVGVGFLGEGLYNNIL